jgi:predicted DNA-binding protein (MmcQ/YjbR family)
LSNAAKAKKPVSPESRLREICIALPEATEQEAWGDPTYRVRGKIFAMEKRGDGRLSVWFKAPEGSQAVLIGADADTFFRPPYVGHKGWVGMRLDRKPDWSEVRVLIERSYRMTAPKKLAATLETQ